MAHLSSQGLCEMHKHVLSAGDGSQVEFHVHHKRALSDVSSTSQQQQPQLNKGRTRHCSSVGSSGLEETSTLRRSHSGGGGSSSVTGNVSLATTGGRRWRAPGKSLEEIPMEHMEEHVF
jgi:hypothetical protein